MAAHVYWRLKFIESAGSGTSQITEIENHIAVAGANITPVTIAALTITNRAENTLGASALTLIQNGNVDDNSIGITLPFSIRFLGKDYTQVFVGSNSYLTFGVGSNLFSGISASNPPIPAIQISARDNSYQRVYAGSENAGATFRIRYEGTNAGSGTVGSPTMVWEITFTASTPTQILVDIGSNNASAVGSSLITDGFNSKGIYANGVLNTGYTLVSNTANIQSNILEIGSDPTNAFDGSLSTFWQQSSDMRGVIIQWQFATAQDVVEHTIAMHTPVPAKTPKGWVIQSSDDNIVWRIEAVISQQISWTASEKRTFTHANYLLSTVNPTMPNILLANTVAVSASSVFCPLQGKAFTNTKGYTGAKKVITGTVVLNGVAIARTVRAYNRLSGGILGETISDPSTGYFSVDTYGYGDNCYVITLHDTTLLQDYNALIYDLVIPV